MPPQDAKRMRAINARQDAADEIERTLRDMLEGLRDLRDRHALLDTLDRRLKVIRSEVG